MTLVPSAVSWATELGLNIEDLEAERPNDWYQRWLTLLHCQRAEVFAEYRRLMTLNETQGEQIVPSGSARAEILAWREYGKLTRAVCDLTGDPLPVGIFTRNAEHEVEDSALKNTCTRCGFVWNRRQPKFVDGLCSSCISLTAKALTARRVSCTPWQGRFARDDVTPLHSNGLPVVPGVRLCGNTDCVNPKHVRKEKRK